MTQSCELCNGEASLYCPSDNAFLCYTCDSKVHCANFLVARHVRSVICPNCRKTDGNRFSGAALPPRESLFCCDCSPPLKGDSSGDDSLSSSSSCISSTVEEAEMTSSSTAPSKKRVRPDMRRRTVVVDLKVEGVLVNWCRRMGMVEERDMGQVVSMAVELLSGCLDGITVWPFRVSLAASFWVAFRVCCRSGKARCPSTYPDLKQVEQISGVPAKLISATEAKLARVFKRRTSREDHKEGWAEC